MISELTIIHLQVASAVMMGYEFFVSTRMKESIDSWAKNKTGDIRDSSLEEIDKQIKVIKKHIPYYISSIVFLLLGLICFNLIGYFEAKLNIIWLAILMFLPTIYFIMGAFNTVLDKLVIEGLAPMVIPLGVWVLSLYLLFTSKGVISGIGFIFLAASFACRYHNAIYA